MKKKFKTGFSEENLKTIQRCIMCDKPAKYIRHTQFSGSHPFCGEHAKLESDFEESDSYKYWAAI